MTVAHSRTEQLLAMRQRHVPRGVASAHPIVIASANGARVVDVDGREYVDFVGGIGVLNVGHAHPKVVQAVRAQIERLTHVAFQVASYEPYLMLAERLNAIAPVPGPAKTALFTTGAEAVENAVKLARAHTGRSGIVAFQHAFHGRTLLGLTLTGKAAPYRQAFGPFAPGVYRAPYPYAYRGWSSERALEAFDALMLSDVAPSDLAAVIFEPVLGEGGFVPAPPEFLRGLRERADRYGFLLIADEIQSGFGRTGRMFAIEHAGVAPDLVTVAKSLAGGLPLSGVVGRADVMDAAAPGGLGGTYGGNPLACAAALAVLDVFERDGILDDAQTLALRLRRTLEELQRRHPAIGDVRGLGAMQAVELVRDRESKEPAPDLAANVIRAARERGVLLLVAGTHGNVIRFLMPLTIEAGALEQALELLEAAFAEGVGA